MSGRPLYGKTKPSALPERLATGNEEALLGVWSSQAPALLGIAAEIMADERAAAGVVEDAFARLWRDAARLPGGNEAPEFWLRLEVRRLALRQCKASPSKSEVLHERPPGMGAWMPDREEIAQLESRRVLLKKVLRQLPRHQQEALALAVWQGLSEPEIAARLGEPLAKIQSSLRAGMRFIRHRMSVVLGKWSAPI